MGIDIYAEWQGQNAVAKRRQRQVWLSVEAGSVGYLREAYHGAPYATMHLCAEAFGTGQADIPAAVLKERLPRALELVEERYRSVYKDATAGHLAAAKQSFRDFVALCEAKEAETGAPVSVVASY